MTPRELRRAKAKQSNKKQTDIAKLHQSHPITYIFSLAILVIIVVTFIGYPVMRNVTGPGSIVFGSYNGDEIKYVAGNYFSEQKDLLAQKLQSSNQNLSPQAEAYQIWQGAFEQTATHMAILDAAKSSGLQVTDDRIDDALTQYGPYVVNGKFDVDQYNQTSNQEKAQNRSLFREDLIDQQYRDDVITDQKYSSAAVDFLQNMASPERKFQYVNYALDDFPSQQVIAYGQDNAKLFRTIKLSRITIKSSERDADAIYQKLEQNPDLFEQLAKNDSRDAFADKGGEMGPMTYNDLKPDFENQADLDSLFALKKGQISEVYKASFGWTIYRIDSVAQDPDFDDPGTLKTVRSYMEQYERGKIEDYLVGIANTFRDKAESGSFVDAAAGDKLKVHETNFFPINYGDSFFLPQIQATDNDDSLSNAEYKADFLQEAFSLKIGAISKPIILDNDVVVIRPEAEQKSDEKYQSVLKSYYPLILQQFSQSDLSNQIMSSSKLKDNFQQVFFKNFAIPSSQQQQAQE